MIVKHDGKKLSIEGKTFELEQPIFDLLPLQDRVIVVFDPQGYTKRDERYDRNVVAIGENGEILWRIERSKGRQVEDDGEEIRSAFVGLDMAQDGKVVHIYEWAGLRHDLDPDTGKISNTLFTK